MAKRISLMQGMSTLFLRVDSRRNDHDAVLVCTDLSKPAATTGQYGFLGNFEIDESCVCLVNHSADRVTWTINFPGETHCSNHGYHLNQRLVIIKQLGAAKAVTNRSASHQIVHGEPFEPSQLDPSRVFTV